MLLCLHSEMEASGGSNFNFLPPGFRFCPTDEDLVLHFLHHKASLSPTLHFSSTIIPDLQLHLYNPWEFRGKVFSNGDVHYFFTQVTERKTTESGYWKDLYIDDPIICTSTGDRVGIKKFYIFFVGEADDPAVAIQTSWVMQEYRIFSCLLNKTDESDKRAATVKSDFGLWVLCRVFEAKDETGRSIFSCEEEDDNESELSFLDEMFLSLDDVI